MPEFIFYFDNNIIILLIKSNIWIKNNELNTLLIIGIMRSDLFDNIGIN